MTDPPSHAPRAAFVVLVVFASLCVYFFGVFPPFANPNELSRLEAVSAMADDGTFSIDAAIGRLGDHEDKAASNGRFYSNKAPGLAFAAYPVYRALRLVLPAASSGAIAPIFLLTRLLTVSLACAIALRRLSARLLENAQPPAAKLVLFAVALGTPFLFYARSFFSHAWTAALLFLAWDRLRRAEEANGSSRGGRTAALAGFLAAWAVISEYSVAPLVAALAVRAVSGRSVRRCIFFGAGAAIPLALLGAYDAICFGSPWALSSAHEASPEYAELARRGVFGFGMPSARTALAYLVDPARGVLLFCPFLAWSILGLVRWWKSGRSREDWWLVVGGLGFFFVCLCGYPNWHGGWSLGSRYLLPGLFFAALPLAWALAGSVSRGLFLAAAIFAASVHGLLTASWPHFPPEMPWPEVDGLPLVSRARMGRAQRRDALRPRRPGVPGDPGGPSPLGRWRRRFRRPAGEAGGSGRGPPRARAARRARPAPTRASLFRPPLARRRLRRVLGTGRRTPRARRRGPRSADAGGAAPGAARLALARTASAAYGSVISKTLQIGM